MNYEEFSAAMGPAEVTNIGTTRFGRKPKGRSPTESTLAELRRRGWVHAKTEHWLPSHTQRAIVAAATKGGNLGDAVARYRRGSPGVRVDLFGFCDVLACVPESGSGIMVEEGYLLAIQTTSQTGVSARVKKITTECATNAAAWLASGGRISVWGWAKVGARWQLREREITREMIGGGE